MKNTFKVNRKKLVERLEQNSVLVLYSGEAPHKTLDQHYKYTPNRNFYYLTGLNKPKMKLMIIKGEEKVFEYLFIEETTEYMRQWVGESMSKAEASAQTGIDETKILYLSSFEKVFSSLMTYGRGLGIKPPKNLYLDLYRVAPTKEPVSLKYSKFIMDNFKELNVMNANEHLSYLRMFKSDYEVELIEKAICFTNSGIQHLMKQAKKRKNEGQLEADFLHSITLDGSEGNSFDTIAASGANATILHYEDNNKNYDVDDMILLDLGALHKNYAADISRTIPLSGIFTERQSIIYDIVLKANKETIEFVKEGITWAELNKFAKDILISECKEIGLIINDAEISQYYYHSIGHFLGLDVHDVGQYDLPLQAGMVITIEPGLYIKEEGIGVRIEDDILVTKEGSVNLSEEIIKDIEDIEKFMKKA